MPGTVETTRALLTLPGPPADVPDLPVALLFDRRTASAAEGLVVAFLGQPRTRVLGTPTAGVPTGNQVHRLGDGSRLVITSAVAVDRDGTVHDSALLPDEPGDENTARAWLHAVAP